MTRKLYIVILCLFIAGKLLAYSGGSGTAGDPYQIATAADLVALSQTPADWGSYFIQTADIDASGISGFTGIGNSTSGFTGNYNGDGYVIDGLAISAAGQTYKALFGFVNGGTVSNLGVTGATISGSSYIAVLSGKLDGGGTISSCYTSGSVSSSSQHAGGLVGQLRTGTISNCYNRASVTGNDRVGGVAGSMEIGTISYCYSTGALSGASNVGGISGFNWNATGTITASYWDVTTSGTAISVGGTGLTTAQMQDQANYSGWDFSSTWSIDSSHNDGYPFLAWQTFPPATIYANSATGSDATGDGTEANPYQSFHKAYTMAIAGDIINLTGTFDWTNGTGEDGDAANTGYTLAKELTIRGQGMANTFIQANSSLASADRSVFYLNMSSGSVTLEDLTVRYGDSKHAAYGGGITVKYSSASDQVLVLNRVKVAECSTYDGGGIRVKYSSLQLNQSEVSNCTATFSMTGGGGISAYQSVVTLMQSTVSENTATAGDGGGIYALDGCSITLTESTVSSNSAGEDGAGIWARGTLTLNSSTVNGNTTGIWAAGIFANNCDVTVSNSTISSNQSSQYVGGISVENGSAIIRNSSIANNSDVSFCGGLHSNTGLSMQNTILANNTSGGTANDYYYDGGTLTDGGYNVVGVSNVAANTTGGFNNATSILYNTKYNDAGTAYTSWSQGGTVLPNQNLNLATAVADNGGPTQTLALTTGSFAAGSATTGIPYGTAPYWNNSPDDDQRGVARTVGQNTSIGAYGFIAPPAVIYANSATGNDATGDGTEANPYQSFHKAYTMAIAGDIINLTGTFDWTNGTGEDGDYAQHGYPIEKALTIRGQGMDSTFIQVDDSLDINTVDRRVFLIYGVSGTITMEDLSIRYGGSTLGGGIYVYSESGDPSLLLNRVKISDCYAGDRGGGIYLYRYSSLQVNSSAINDCVALRGGGIYLNRNSSLQVNSSEISGCEALGNDHAGGGIYMDESVVVITNSSISDNSAPDGSGGGIMVLGPCSVTLTETTVHGNSAKNGAGIYAYGSDDESSFITITGCTISGNTASEYTGGMGAEYCDNVTISNSTISENSASYIGALIFANSDNVIIKNSTIANNQENESDYTGGFMLFGGSTVSLINTILANNISGGTANDYFYANGTLTDGGYNVVGVSNVAASATGGFNHATSILYNTKYNDAGTAYTSWSQGGTVLSNQNLNLATAVADNGGPTQTLAITNGSFTIGVGMAEAEITSDQRGITRNNPPTIGAYEFGGCIIWNGSQSTAWNSPGNWTPAVVPTASDNVIITTDGNAPFIDGSSANGAFCNNLTINNGAAININSDGSLSIYGSATFNGTVNILGTP